MPEPLFKTPPTLVDPTSGTRAWFFDDARTVVDQTTGAMTLAVAQFFTGAMEAELQRRWVSAGKKVRYVHDWRSCQSYDAAARQLIIDWGRASRPHSEHVAVHLSPDASPFIRIAAATGISVLRMAKMPIELVTDLDSIIAKLA
jgi:hypothetical protein